jgi:hypothetical protein
MTSQGSAHGRFTRAIQQRNLFQAELALREMGAPSLLVALDYLDLLAEVRPGKLLRKVLPTLLPRVSKRGRRTRRIGSPSPPQDRRPYAEEASRATIDITQCDVKLSQNAIEASNRPG